MYRTTVLASILALTMATASQAAAPQLVNYQGLLSDAVGDPVVDASYSVVFIIYDAPAAGTSVWTETQNVNTTDGLFAVLLGSVTSIEDTVFSGTTRYLGIAVEGDPELAPRTAMVSVPYALRVSTVDGASGGNITSKVAIGPGVTNSGLNAFAVGESNSASGNSSTVGGGAGNTASGDSAAIGGGDNNIASGGHATVGGGRVNTASGSNATIGGGGFNTASSLFATVGGGSGNQALGKLSTVGGGGANTASGGDATVAGGRSNTASGDSATVAGGTSNTASGFIATVGGGGFNTASGDQATVAGGESNTASSISATVGGGNNNTASGGFATVAGGKSDTATGTFATVGGGQSNTADGNHATVAGGGGNTASFDRATVGGGVSNTASGFGATIGGGQNNIASGDFATVAGGIFNTASGIYSYAAGRRAKAIHDGTFVLADTTDADFASTAANQFLIRAGGGVGIGSNAPVKALQIGDVGVSGSEGMIRLESRSSSGNAQRKWNIGVPQTGEDLSGAGYSFVIDDPLTAATEFVVEFATGKVGIGTGSPNYMLDVRGTIGNTGTLYHSDRRWKRNIVTLSQSLEKLQKLRGVSFTWKADKFKDFNFPEGKQIGLIAQEVEEVMPEVVNTGADGYKSVDYGKLVALLIEANKEQQQQIDELKEMVQQLADKSNSNESTYGLK